MNTKPFGFIIVDKDGRLWRAGRDVVLNPEPLKIDIKWLNSGDSPHTNGPYRIVELYTKEQLERILRGLMCGDCFCEVAIGNPMYSDHTSGCKSATAFLDGIVESSSDEKGES